LVGGRAEQASTRCLSTRVGGRVEARVEGRGWNAGGRFFIHACPKQVET
jgi:hypothetical protein